MKLTNHSVRHVLHQDDDINHTRVIGNKNLPSNTYHCHWVSDDWLGWIGLDDWCLNYLIRTTSRLHTVIANHASPRQDKHLGQSLYAPTLQANHRRQHRSVLVCQHQQLHGRLCDVYGIPPKMLVYFQ
jgi:hypothetical protein